MRQQLRLRNRRRRRRESRRRAASGRVRPVVGRMTSHLAGNAGQTKDGTTNVFAIATLRHGNLVLLTNVNAGLHGNIGKVQAQQGADNVVLLGNARQHEKEQDDKSKGRTSLALAGTTQKVHFETRHDLRGGHGGGKGT